MNVKGIANWACVQAPNTTFENTYQIDVTIDKKQADAVKKAGLTVKETDDGEYVVKLKRKQFRKNGEENQKPRVVDAHKQPFDGFIGNGSLVKAAFNIFEWNNRFGSGVSSDLFAVQVLDLVEYQPRDDDGFEEEDGFVQQTNNNENDDLPFDDD